MAGHTYIYRMVQHHASKQLVWGSQHWKQLSCNLLWQLNHSSTFNLTEKCLWTDAKWATGWKVFCISCTSNYSPIVISLPLSQHMLKMIGSVSLTCDLYQMPSELCWENWLQISEFASSQSGIHAFLQVLMYMNIPSLTYLYMYRPCCFFSDDRLGFSLYA